MFTGLSESDLKILHDQEDKIRETKNTPHNSFRL